MNKLKKLVSVVLAFVTGILPAALSGCNKNIKELFVKESPWYSYRKFEVCDQYRKGRPMNTYFTVFAGVDGDNLYFYTSGEYDVPDDADWETVDYADYRFANLDVYDKYGELVKTIDLNNSVDFSSVVYTGQEVSEYYFDPFYVNPLKDGKLKLKTSVFMLPLEISKDFDLVYDVRNEQVVSLKAAPGEFDADTGAGFSYSIAYDFEGYSVVPYESYDNTGLGNKKFLYVEKPDGESTIIDLDEQIPVSDSQAIWNVIYSGKDKALVDISNGFNTEYYMLDLKTCKLSSYKEDTSWFENYLNQHLAEYIDGTGYIFSSGGSIKTVDFSKKEIKDIFSFDSCNINRSDTEGLTVVSVTDKEIILTGLRPFAGNEEMYETTVYVLTKEKVNPNVGKTILKAATIDNFPRSFCEAVSRFNESDPEYYIMLDYSYSISELWRRGEIEPGYGNMINYLEKESNLSSQLAMDLITGDGPDIILDSHGFSQLNNDDYLIDLSKEIDSSCLFDKIEELSEKDGKLYQLPLCFAIGGIVARRSEIGDDRTGFTYDQYIDFVKNKCNGYDSILSEQGQYFIDCLPAVYDSCISGDKVDFGTPEVKALADYVKDNVTEHLDETEMVYTSGGDFEGGQYYPGSAFDSFIYDYMISGLEDLTFLGLPSHNGCGPELYITVSVAVSAKTKAKDKCIELVKSLLTDEIQLIEAGYNGGSPATESAFDIWAEEVIDINNERIREYRKEYEAGRTFSPDMRLEEIDPVVIQNYKDAVNACSCIPSIDSAVSIIIREEMPAYFTGQKSFDDVIKIINNRVTTYINERGK